MLSAIHLFTHLANDGEKSRLQSEVGRLKNKLSEGETRCNVLQSRLKELQSEQLATRKKLDTSQNNNKDLRQQVCIKLTLNQISGKDMPLAKSCCLFNNPSPEFIMVNSR